MQTVKDKVIFFLWMACFWSQVDVGLAAEKENEKKKKKPFTLEAELFITSEDMFRGISQTDGRPAYQGELTLSLEKVGLYGTVWGSNTRIFGEEPQIVEEESLPPVIQWGTLEVDTSVGIARSVTDTWSYDVHLIRYNYPGTTLFEYNETIASVTYRFLTALVGYSANVFNTHQSGTYYNLAAQFDLPKKYNLIGGLNIAGTIGHYHLPPNIAPSYNDYSFTVTKTIKNVKISLAWVDTNHKFHSRLDRGRIVATLGISL